ncbi:MAG: SDR family oxidoreductase [Alphaproteobacteria bacterium]|nr:SDR family oxidoreductase [Alphaproteobacteria bacterium]
MGRVEGKVCLITGGGAGLGRADAMRLAEEGARVVVTDVNREGGEETAHLASNGAIFLTQDVADEESWPRVLEQVRRHFGQLNVLVNNAGIVVVKDVEATTTEEWRRVQSIMTDGVFFGLKYGIGLIKQNGEPGSIVNVSSTAALLGFPPYFAYSAAKGAVRSMTKSAAIHCQQSRYRIRVNSIHPGAIATAMVAKATSEGGGTGAEEAGEGQPPGPGLGDPVDVANTVLFLASDESRFINGAELVIDNGFTVSP